ncbi:hypothetical protein EV715DRAFT_297058 [Schizophyllum commune]
MKLCAIFALATIVLASVVGAAPVLETNGQRLARGLPPLRPRSIANAATPVKRSGPSARALKRDEPSARAAKRNEPSARAYSI